MSRTVDALLPLSLLVAVRAIDRPVVDPETEFVDELRNKRFGLSDTVHAQILRYEDALRRRQRVPWDDGAALARLIGRRPDAEPVFRAAGRYLAERVYQMMPQTTRSAVRSLPRPVARPLAMRQIRRVARRYFGGTVTRAGQMLLLEVPQGLTSLGGHLAAGCTYYESALQELLRLLTGTDADVAHVRCTARHEGKCQWQTSLEGRGQRVEGRGAEESHAGEEAVRAES